MVIKVGLEHLGLNKNASASSIELDMSDLFQDTLDFNEAIAGLEGAVESLEDYDFTVGNIEGISATVEKFGVDAAMADFVDGDGQMSTALKMQKFADCIGDKNASGKIVAGCEGLLADWWQKIKEFFAKVWEYIKNFWQWLTSSAVRRMAALKKVEEKLKGSVDTKFFEESMVRALSKDNYKTLHDAIIELAKHLRELNTPTTIATAAEEVIKRLILTDVADQDRVDVAVAAFKGATGLDKYLTYPKTALSAFGYVVNSEGKLERTASEEIKRSDAPVMVSTLKWSLADLTAAVDQCKKLNDDNSSMKALTVKSNDIQKTFVDQLNAMERKMTEVVTPAAGANETKLAHAAGKRSIANKTIRALVREVQKANTGLTKASAMIGKGTVMCCATVITLGGALKAGK